MLDDVEQCVPMKKGGALHDGAVECGTSVCIPHSPVSAPIRTITTTLQGRKVTRSHPPALLMINRMLSSIGGLGMGITITGRRPVMRIIVMHQWLDCLLTLPQLVKLAQLAAMPLRLLVHTHPREACM